MYQRAKSAAPFLSSLPLIPLRLLRPSSTSTSTSFRRPHRSPMWRLQRWEKKWENWRKTAFFDSRSKQKTNERGGCEGDGVLNEWIGKWMEERKRWGNRLGNGSQFNELYAQFYTTLDDICIFPGLTILLGYQRMHELFENWIFGLKFRTQFPAIIVQDRCLAED